MKIVFNESRQVAGLFFLPSGKYTTPGYVKPGSFKDRDVTIGTGEWALPGTLSLPTGEGPFPAVVLVHGSGPQDRDETVGPNKPFLDIASGLASRGIAVLRYDKRTRVHSDKFAANWDSITVREETIDDALAAVALLTRTEQIDVQRIYVLGHSLGGMLIPKIATSGESKIAGFVVMAGTARPLEDVLVDQFAYLFGLDGVMTEFEKSELERAKGQAAKIKDPNLKMSSLTDDFLFGVAPSYWLDLRSYNPTEVAKKVSQPMLILQGERDYQVTMQDFSKWKEALSGRSNVEFRQYPKLNHLFMAGEDKSGPAEYQFPGNVDQKVVEDIAGWIGAKR